MENRELFGGAITCLVPGDYTDVSDIRPVPDNQEVYTNVDTDASLIVEMLERPPVPDEAALQHLLSDLLEYQEAAIDAPTLTPLTDGGPLDVPGAAHDGQTAFVAAAHVIAHISKYKEEARNRVLVLAAVVRLPGGVDTDVLVSQNLPLYVDAGSSSAARVVPGALPAPEDEPARIAAAVTDFRVLVSSFTVKDWGLFG